MQAPTQRGASSARRSPPWPRCRWCLSSKPAPRRRSRRLQTSPGPSLRSFNSGTASTSAPNSATRSSSVSSAVRKPPSGCASSSCPIAMSRPSPSAPTCPDEGATMPKPDITEDTLFASVSELDELLKTQKISSEALTRAYLERLEKIGPKLGAVVTITRDLALEQARRADREIKAGRYRGPLHGVPYGAKDLLATRGIPTTWGAEPYKDQVFDHDATAVRKLREAGAVLVAKLAMVELAGAFGYNNANASFTGPGRTPWNLDYWSGGSSSGSGAAVAAGLVAFAIGSETSGSIITPAAFCGVAGMRPTYGRVSRYGAMALCWTLDKLGPMCRSADCCGLVLAAILGKDPNDPSTIDSSSWNYA